MRRNCLGHGLRLSGGDSAEGESGSATGFRDVLRWISPDRGAPGDPSGGRPDSGAFAALTLLFPHRIVSRRTRRRPDTPRPVPDAAETTREVVHACPTAHAQSEHADVRGPQVKQGEAQATLLPGDRGTGG